LNAHNADHIQSYKIPRGDGILNITGETYQNASFVGDILQESHEWWQELVSGQAEDSNEINFNQTSMANIAESYVASEDANEELKIPMWSTYGEAVMKPERFQQWYFVDAEEGTFES
jgi:inorganic pyrophosphatase